MDRQELARFLRARRERMTPFSGGRRRTPGLRREEVAASAGMSTDYYTRLEQARGPHPSPAVVAGLARALDLSADERDYLFRLADVPVPASGSASVRPGVRLLLSRLRSDCATVITDTGDVLAWTPLAEAVFPEVVDGWNLFRLFFLSGLESRIPAADRDDVARAHVADLRATLARRPSVRPLVESLLESPLFARLWAEQEVAVRRSAQKRIVHPVVGLLELDCEVLLSPEQDQRLVLHTAAPGSVTAARLDLLRERAVDALEASELSVSAGRIESRGTPLAGDPAQPWALSPRR